MNRKQVLGVALTGMLLVTLGGCPIVVPPTEVDQFETVRTALATYFGGDPMGAIKAETVFASMNDANELNQPYVLSVRSADHYALGHVPGAANIPWRMVADPNALDDVPTDRQVVVYCYTGHTGGVATCYLGAQGYDAVNMKFGMGAWTRDETIRVAAAFDDTVDSHDYTIETTDNPASSTNELPTLNVTTSTDTAEIVRAAAKAYLDAGTPPVITAADLFALLNDGDDTNDPFIISVRSADHYALGHLPGAINIPWKTIAELDNLKKIPADQDIVIYCYTGHTGGLATTALNMLGYNCKNLKFGIMSWTQDADVRVISPFIDANDSHDYATEP